MGKNILMGALAGTLIGTLGVFLLTNKKEINDWAEKAKDIGSSVRDLGNTVYEEVRTRTEPRETIAKKNFAKGSIAGLILGVVTAALLTPKSGKQLRRDLSNRYNNVSEKTQQMVDMVNGYHLVTPVRKNPSHHTKKRTRTKQ